MTSLSNAAKRDIETVLHPYTNLDTFRTTGPLIIERGEGIHVFDTEGKEYIEGMAGLNGIYIPAQWQGILNALPGPLPDWVEFRWQTHINNSQVAKIVLLMLVIWFLPNTQDWVSDTVDTAKQGARGLIWRVIDRLRLGQIISRWSANPITAVWIGMLLCLSILEIASDAPSEFLYFNF